MKGLIYDLDGVIVDTARYHYLGWKKLADELGVAFDEARNEKLKGLSRRDSLIALLGYTPVEEDLQAWCTRKNGYYLDYVSGISADEILPGALEMIGAVERNPEWCQALASSSRNAPLILSKLGIADRFQAVVDGTATEKTKPDPELFLIAARKLGLSPAEVVVIEDAEAGVAAAKSGGMRCVGLGDPAVLGQADLVVKNLAAITLNDIAALLNGARKAR